MVTSDEWFAQVGYRLYPDHQFLHVPEGEIPAALTKLADAGYKDVIVSLAPLDPAQIPGGYEVRRALPRHLYLSRP